ncbi:MAG TPA: IS110 family transposase [Anaerolineales bacterium]|nr:IS110 family transposase [Anaerolineales bacterium]
MLSPKRFIGIDIHKAYFVAVGVDDQKQVVFGPQTVPNHQLDTWVAKFLLPTDAVVAEMTVNTYLFHDIITPRVHSFIAVHPPNVTLVTGAKVKTDKKAAMALAQLHAVGMLEGVWIPPELVRGLRAAIAQREKMLRLSTQAKNRLSSLLHCRHLTFSGEGSQYAPEQKEWWLALPLTDLEKLIVQTNLETLEFARTQIETIEQALKREAAKDDRVPLLAQLPGVGVLTALTILAAIGIIDRFEDARHLVGYAGLGTRVHDSGQVHQNGRITKAGRRDLRRAMVNAANIAVQHHPFWKKEFARLEAHLGRSKAIVAIARRLLVAVWHILTRQEKDRHADERSVAASFINLAYKMGTKNLPNGINAKTFARQQMDRLKIGAGMTAVPWGSKRITLPPSQLKG